MSSPLDLIRPEILALKPYEAASYEDGLLRLNANETPWAPLADSSARDLNRYPGERPIALTKALADFYAVQADELLVTRGSSEGIDLLIRAFCRASIDEIVICPPTFGMYRVYAEVQGAAVREIPLLIDQGYGVDIKRILSEWTANTRLLFICSPNNPTGNQVPAELIQRLCEGLAGKGVVVLDDAYGEFADDKPNSRLLAKNNNLIVLKTLSKALGLAGIRCGSAIGDSGVIGILNRILPPYSFPTPSENAALSALAPDNRAEFESRIKVLKGERDSLSNALASLPGVTKVWPSDANFLMVEFDNPQRALEVARDGGVLLRDFSQNPYTPNCLRITVGSPDQNTQLLESLKS
jgi:histidinol-phosphate aminotransferase